MINTLFGGYPGPDTPWQPENAIAFGPVRWYAIFIIIGFIVAIVLACLKMWKRYKISTEPFYWFILIGVPLAIFGANFGSCVLGEPAGKPWSDFWTHFGEGLAVEWGVLFVVVAAFIYFPLVLRSPKYRVRNEFSQEHEVQRVSFWMYADAVMPCILIAQFIGRWGNYMNQEVYGATVTSDGLAKFLHDCLPFMYVGGEWKQPLFLWEGLANLGMFFILYFGVEFIECRKAGDMGAGYLLWYGTLRLGLEPLRDQQYFSTTTIIFSAMFVAFGLGFILLNHLVLARKRKYNVLHYLINKPIESLNKKGYPKKIKKLEDKLNRLQASQSSDQETITNTKMALNTYRVSWAKLQDKYNSQSYKDSFTRKESELVYFGRW